MLGWAGVELFTKVGVQPGQAGLLSVLFFTGVAFVQLFAVYLRCKGALEWFDHTCSFALKQSDADG